MGCAIAQWSARARVGRADSSSRAARMDVVSGKYKSRFIFVATRLTCLFWRNSHCHGHIFDAHGHQILLTSTFQRNLDCRGKSYPQARRFFIQRIVDKCDLWISLNPTPSRPSFQTGRRQKASGFKMLQGGLPEKRHGGKLSLRMPLEPRHLPCGARN